MTTELVLTQSSNMKMSWKWCRDLYFFSQCLFFSLCHPSGNCWTLSLSPRFHGLYAAAKSLQSCLTLCDPMDCGPPRSSIHGIFQARVLEWGAIAFSSMMLWSILISLFYMWLSRFPSTTYWRGYLFSTVYFCLLCHRLIGHRRVSLFLGFLSRSFDLYFCFYASTILFWRRRQWHPTPVLLPGKSHGWRSVVGCSPRGRKESDTTEWLTHAES